MICKIPLASDVTSDLEVIEQGQRDWATLICEFESAVAEGMDPKSEPAAMLAERWSALIKGFTGGDSEIQSGLEQNVRRSDVLTCKFSKALQ